MAIAAQLFDLWRGAPEDLAVRRRRPPVKPDELTWGVDERPPALTLWSAAVQHVLIATTVGMFFPMLVLDAAGASHETVRNVMSISMLALGIGTLLLCLNERDLGFGFLVPASFSGDVVDRAANAMVEIAESLELLIAPGRTARVTMTFDECWLDVVTEYEGRPLVTSASVPAVDDLLADHSQLTRLGAIMLRRLATRLTTSASGGVERITLGFEH